MLVVGGLGQLRLSDSRAAVQWRVGGLTLERERMCSSVELENIKHDLLCAVVIDWNDVENRVPCCEIVTLAEVHRIRLLLSIAARQKA